jgi:hypothetical protein
MQEQYNAIGETAGKIWSSLQKNGKKTVAGLSKDTGADAALVNQAIGWLAREGKLNFQKKGASIELSLCDAANYCG